MKEKSVYEVVDYTNDETYYPLGIFPTFEEALSETKSSEKPYRPISFYDPEEFEIIKIMKRKFGFSENGVCVYELQRNETIEEENDYNSVWKTTLEKDLRKRTVK